VDEIVLLLKNWCRQQGRIKANGMRTTQKWDQKGSQYTERAGWRLTFARLQGSRQMLVNKTRG